MSLTKIKKRFADLGITFEQSQTILLKTGRRKYQLVD